MKYDRSQKIVFRIYDFVKTQYFSHLTFYLPNVMVVSTLSNCDAQEVLCIFDESAYVNLMTYGQVITSRSKTNFLLYEIKKIRLRLNLSARYVTLVTASGLRTVARTVFFSQHQHIFFLLSFKIFIYLSLCFNTM